MTYQRLYEDKNLEKDIIHIINNEEDCIDAIRKNNTYEYHYFLSPLRQDIFNWYPFKKEGNLLEIGASYGQLTPLFTQKVNRVVAVEDSESKCNAISKRAENAEVLCSHFNELEINEKFDYIILCNIFEYAKSFFKSDTSYVDYLNYLKNFLKDDGVILLALSNRLGLKYFAGNKEEHLNQFFKGIEGFNNVKNVQTFTRTELTNIINASEFTNYKFFYPYPSHEFTQMIHTDKTINKNPFAGAIEFSNERIDVFDEGTLNQTLSNDNLAQYFANSFLVEIRSSDRKRTTDNIDFVKLHSDRKAEYQIFTTMWSDGTVSKSPLTSKANNHIKNMFEKSEYVLGKIKCLNAEMKGDSICYDFLKQKSLEQMIMEAIAENNRDKFFKIVEDFHDALFYNSFESNDYANEEFLEVFKEKSDITFHCHEKSNIDLNLANIFIIDGEYTAIDYEWIYDFPIPLEFQFFTVFNYYLYSNNMVKEFTSFEEIFNHVNLDIGNYNLFLEWNCNFLRCVLNRPPLTQKVIPLENIDKIEDYARSNKEITLKIESLKRDIELKNKEIIEKNKEIEKFQNSNSWKITKPMRKAKSILKK